MTWTAQQQKSVYDTLTSHGVSSLGAAALISRWSNVEDPNGLGSTFGGYQGHALGIGQWLGSRKNDLLNFAQDNNLNPYAVNTQALFAAQELNTNEKAAGAFLNNATTPEEAAIGASMFERAGGYDPTTGTDNFTSQTASGIPSVLSNVGASASDNVIPPDNFDPSLLTTSADQGDFSGAAAQIEAGTGKLAATSPNKSAPGSSLVDAINKQTAQLAANTRAQNQNETSIIQTVLKAVTGYVAETQAQAENQFIRGGMIVVGVIFILGGVFALVFAGGSVTVAAKKVASTAAKAGEVAAA